MESGLEDRNNLKITNQIEGAVPGLNGVRPRRPEQFVAGVGVAYAVRTVSMESGLEDRNNRALWRALAVAARVSMESGLEDRNNASSAAVHVDIHAGRLNGVRPRRPEQSVREWGYRMPRRASQWSPA